jgi:tyrosyl-tRNA synthetase
MAAMSGILDDLDARELVHASTDRAALQRRLDEGPISLYYGCDPTADSLHVGNLIGLLILRRFQDAGHRPIALAGGATGMVGDPSGRSEERNFLDDATLSRNVAAIKAQMARIVDLDTGKGRLVDNREWTAQLSLIDFLRDVGKHVTVNQMVARESVRARMESEHGISYTEFTYMLLQANDYLWLRDHLDCELQIGGSDQWGNILSGVDLIRRTRGTAVHGLCWPLITAADGTKVGKTTGARAWLDPDKTSPYAFHQHFMQTGDAELRRMLAQFTLLPVTEVDQIAGDHAADPRRRHGQRRLAREVTTIVHGPDAARAAEEAADVLFGGTLDGVSAAALDLVAREVPVAALEPGESLDDGVGVGVVEVLLRAGLVASRAEARRQLQQGGVTVNGEPVGDDRPLRESDRLHGRWVLVRRGKKQWAVLDARSA